MEGGEGLASFEEEKMVAGAEVFHQSIPVLDVQYRCIAESVAVEIVAAESELVSLLPSKNNASFFLDYWFFFFVLLFLELFFVPGGVRFFSFLLHFSGVLGLTLFSNSCLRTYVDIFPL